MRTVSGDNIEQVDSSVPLAKISNRMRENQGIPERKFDLLGSPCSRSGVNGNLSNFGLTPLS